MLFFSFFPSYFLIPLFFLPYRLVSFFVFSGKISWTPLYLDVARRDPWRQVRLLRHSTRCAPGPQLSQPREQFFVRRTSSTHASPRSYTSN